MVLRLGIAAYRTVLELGPGQTADLSHLDRTDFAVALPYADFCRASYSSRYRCVRGKGIVFRAVCFYFILCG